MQTDRKEGQQSASDSLSTQLYKDCMVATGENYCLDPGRVASLFVEIDSPKNFRRY